MLCWLQKQLSLTSSQKEEISTLSHTYRKDMGALAQTRRVVLTALQAATPDLCSCSNQAKNSLESAKLSMKLQEVFRQEHQVHSEYVIAVLDKVCLLSTLMFIYGACVRDPGRVRTLLNVRTNQTG
jgi:hypothetical protein